MPAKAKGFADFWVTYERFLICRAFGCGLVFVHARVSRSTRAAYYPLRSEPMDATSGACPVNNF